MGVRHVHCWLDAHTFLVSLVPAPPDSSPRVKARKAGFRPCTKLFWNCRDL